MAVVNYIISLQRSGFGFILHHGGARMKIYILRHGIAEDSNSGGDPHRVLTQPGRYKVEKITRFLSGKVRPGKILTSPYVRAVQTAEIAAEVWGIKNRVEFSDSLLPLCGAADTLTACKAAGVDEIMVVGHNPHLSYFVSECISGGSAYTSLKKASVTCIEFESAPEIGRGNLKWMITPGILGL
jgi:phosphohistidine phosphatase